MKNLTSFVAILFMSVAFLTAGQTSAADESRGKAIYTTYCIACHTTQVHWREKKLATDWTSLVFQVRRWEQNAGLSLSGDDVDAVARYLNGLFYRFPAPNSKESG